MDNVFVLQDLDRPTAARIKEIEDMSNDISKFHSAVGTMSDNTKVAPLEHAFWTSTYMFSDAKLKNDDFQKVYLFTNDDNPTANHDNNVKQALITRAQDLQSSSKEITLWPMADKNTFDLKPLYADVVESPERDVLFMDNPADLETYFDMTRQHTYSKRRLGRVPLRFAGQAANAQTQIGMALYATVMPATKPSPVQLDKKSVEPLKIETKYICEETMSTLTPDQLLTYRTYGANDANIKVPFSKEDMTTVRKMFPLGVEILGFKPMSCLRAYHSMRSPYFATPDEAGVAGSNKAIVALVMSMAKMKKVAVARIVLRRGASPRLALLWPQLQLMEGANMIDGLGFNVLPMPFANDIRDIAFPEFDPSPTPTDDQVQAAVKAVNALTFQESAWTPSAFEHPELQKHWANLEALAQQYAEVEWTEEEDDTIQPDNEKMKETWGPELIAFRESYGGDDDEITKKKRPAASRASGGGGGAAKKVKTEAISVEQAAKDGVLSKQTVATLKEFLTSKGLAVGGKKADLMDRVMDHLGLD